MEVYVLRAQLGHPQLSTQTALCDPRRGAQRKATSHSHGTGLEHRSQTWGVTLGLYPVALARSGTGVIPKGPTVLQGDGGGGGGG